MGRDSNNLIVRDYLRIRNLWFNLQDTLNREVKPCGNDNYLAKLGNLCYNYNMY